MSASPAEEALSARLRALGFTEWERRNMICGLREVRADPRSLVGVSDDQLVSFARYVIAWFEDVERGCSNTHSRARFFDNRPDRTRVTVFRGGSPGLGK